jgi:hypothetical protein
VPPACFIINPTTSRLYFGEMGVLCVLCACVSLCLSNIETCWTWFLCCCHCRQHSQKRKNEEWSVTEHNFYRCTACFPTHCRSAHESQCGRCHCEVGQKCQKPEVGLWDQRTWRRWTCVTTHRLLLLVPALLTSPQCWFLWFCSAKGSLPIADGSACTPLNFFLSLNHYVC